MEVKQQKKWNYLKTEIFDSYVLLIAKIPVAHKSQMLNKREITATTWTKNEKEFFVESLCIMWTCTLTLTNIFFLANNFRSIINKFTHFHLCSKYTSNKCIYFKEKYCIIKGLSFHLKHSTLKVREANIPTYLDRFLLI